jgi:uncharacterized membrane protein
MTCLEWILLDLLLIISILLLISGIVGYCLQELPEELFYTMTGLGLIMFLFWVIARILYSQDFFIRQSDASESTLTQSSLVSVESEIPSAP